MIDFDIFQARLLEVLHYDPQTGFFTWLARLAQRAPIGARAGSLHSSGYVYINIDRRAYRAHRLAWLYMTAAWPKDEVDHRNGVKSDNRWVNLREADRRINVENLRGAKRHNNLGILGVSTCRGKFQARIFTFGARKHLGTFDTPELAHQAYLKAKRQLHDGNTL